MNNDLTALNNYLFEQLERLNDDELKPEQLEIEIKRAETVAKISKAIVDNADIALKAQKHFDEYEGNRKIANPLLGVKN